MKPRYLVAVGLCLLLLYPLSIGPAVWISFHLHPSSRAYDSMVSVVYRPLLGVAAHWSPLQDALGRYLAMWVPPVDGY